jgi:hypothetical protein
LWCIKQLKIRKKHGKIIEENFDLSIEIFSRFNDVKFKIIEEFRTELMNYIIKKSSNFDYKYQIETSQKIDGKYSKIIIRESKDSKILFVIEAFSGWGNFNGDLTCGVLTMWDDLTDHQREILKVNNTKGWFPKKINLDENTKRNSTLKKVSTKKSRSLLVESIGEKVFQFISKNEEFAQKLKRKIESVS